MQNGTVAQIGVFKTSQKQTRNNADNSVSKRWGSHPVWIIRNNNNNHLKRQLELCEENNGDKKTFRYESSWLKLASCVTELGNDFQPLCIIWKIIKSTIAQLGGLFDWCRLCLLNSTNNKYGG